MVVRPGFLGIQTLSWTNERSLLAGACVEFDLQFSLQCGSFMFIKCSKDNLETLKEYLLERFERAHQN